MMPLDQAKDVVCSDFVLDDTSVRSPRKLCIFTIKNDICGIQKYIASFVYIIEMCFYNFENKITGCVVMFSGSDGW